MNFYTLYLILGRWPLGRLSCDLWLSLDYTACLTSQYTVLIITIDRFCSVHIPAKYRNWRTDRKVLILVAITWIIPSSVFFTTIMGWPYFNTSVSPRRSDECYAEFSNDPVFNTIFTVCYFWITLCVMLGLYVGIYRVAADLQRRSDEKRNRVSGLITSNTQNGKSNKQMKINSQINPLQNTNQKGTNAQTYPNSSSLGCPGDSSGFDSDEGKLNPVKSNVLSKTAEKRKMYSQIKGHNVTQPIPESQIQHSVSPFQKIEARCDVLPGVLENVRIIPPKPKVNDSSKPMPDNFDDSAEGDIGYVLPASVMLNEGIGLMISSPVLTDDDSGLEVNYYHPALSKLKKESSTSEFFDFLNEDETDAKTKKQDQIGNQKKESKRGENNQSGTDQEYQNRVMEQFKQRLAALNNQTVKHRAANCIKPNDQPTNVGLSKSKLTTNHSRLTLNTSNFSESTSSKGTENTTNNLCNNNNESRTVNCVANQKAQFSSSNIEGSNSTDADINLQSPLFANNSSPIWKSRPVCCDGSASAPCSIRSYQCFNRRKQSDECISQQICVICMSQQQQQQQDSDTLQSSSSYGDFTSPVVCDEKCLCHSQTYTHNANSTKVSIGTRLLYYLKTFKLKSPSVNIVEQVKKSLIRRKSKQEVIERGRRENRARKALRTITFIMGAFVICWTPYHILIMIKGICDDIQQKYTCVNEIFYSVTYWLCYMNSPINPFCYALANAQFKKTFLRIFHGDFRRL
ncbi:unnamed protein product [Trichobilharzia szidati]|nr:unnamed protein product [Trichobilharzia szidati]